VAKGERGRNAISRGFGGSADKFPAPLLRQQAKLNVIRKCNKFSQKPDKNERGLSLDQVDREIPFTDGGNILSTKELKETERVKKRYN